MESRRIWTAEEAQGDFVRVLEEARSVGPQQIHDATGIYELKLKLDRTKLDAAEFLARRASSS